MLRLFLVVEWYCALSLHKCVFDVRASSSSLGYFCTKFCFFRTSIAELARKKLHTQSLTHSTSLFDGTGNQRKEESSANMQNTL